MQNEAPDHDHDKRRAAAEYVEAIMRSEHARKTAAEPPGRRRANRGPLLSLLPVLIGLTAWNIATYAGDQTVFSAEEERASARFHVYLTAVAIDDHRAETGSLPASLNEIGLGDDGVRYSLAGQGYILTAATEAGPVSYRAGEDLQPFADELDNFHALAP
jgi:hypothetical protein